MAPPDLFSAPQAQSSHLWVSPLAPDHPSEGSPLLTGFDVESPTPRSTYLQALPGFSTIGRYRNINLLSIAYGFYPLGLGPTNPTWIHLPSETLGLRRTRFSRAFTLLIPAFALELAPENLTTPLPRPSTLPYPWTAYPSQQSLSAPLPH